MALLLALINKQASTDTLTVPEAGDVQLFVRGTLGPKGRVIVSLKGADGQFHTYPDLVFTEVAARTISLLKNDQLRIECVTCTAAAVEVRQ
ncbi:hypothetical protein [Pseudomonas sp. C9-3]|uniref:hypothetical protein n=1 Tax=Pseudomonas sp. C9-3 TaxID=3078264 RepID=UPI0028E47569|nr:hypothetical protein [Pseudomonas sp. C9-3]